MSITVLSGLPGSGKTARLIETVTAARAQGRPAFTFACSDSHWITARMAETGGRLLSRRPGLSCSLDHFVSTRECIAILDRIQPDALVAFEEAHAFDPDIVPHWIEASRRNLEVLIALPSDLQRRRLEGTAFEEARLTITCQRCQNAEAVSFVLLSDLVETLSVCEPCNRQLGAEARQDIRALLERPAAYLGEKQLYQPIELEEYADWIVVRPDSQRRMEIITQVLRDNGLLPDVESRGRVTYLDIGCNTGFFCHHLRKLGFHAEGIDVAEREIKVAKLLDAFVRRDFNVYTHTEALRYLQETRDRQFDVTSAFSVFQWIMVESLDRGIACLEMLFAKTRQCCFLELGYASEPHYQGRLPDQIDREWVRRIMEQRGAFSEVRVFEAREHGLVRDLFVGLKAGAGRS